MELLWFYVAIALAISDEIHTRLVWDYVRDFYIIFGGLISSALDDVMETWIVHEALEALFHFIFISCVFFSLKVGFLAALIHFLLDVSHSIVIRHMPWLPHRALHFVFESLFFIAVFGL
ncbi:MAG: hypothetical protein IK021_00250 [Methanobrevibacter sp.]|nr:hypothetical protein [Methanobrevibacter sp.]MBR5953853.1 hypothetical protein [Methanobrevibacter sp.]